MAGAVAPVATPVASAPARSQSPSNARDAAGPTSFDQALGAAGGDARSAASKGKATDATAKPAKDDTSPAGGKAKDSQDTAQTGTAQAKATDSGVMSWLMGVINGQGATTTTAPPATATAIDGKAQPVAGKATSASPASAGLTVKANAATSAAITPPATDEGEGDADADDAAPPAKLQALPQAHADAPAVAAAHTPASAPAVLPDATAQAPLAATPQFATALDNAASPAMTPAATPATQPHTALPQDRDAWADTLNDQVRWQIGHDVREARLELHPRDLGSVQVQVRVTAEGTEIRFAAEHPQAREALQQALPQLRSLLAGDGLQLSQAQVGSQSQSSRQFNAPSAFAPGNDGDADGADAEVLSPGRSIRVGLVDDFA